MGELEGEAGELDDVRVGPVPFEERDDVAVVLGHALVEEIPLRIVEQADAVPVGSRIFRT